MKTSYTQKSGALRSFAAGAMGVLLVASLPLAAFAKDNGNNGRNGNLPPGIAQKTNASLAVDVGDSNGNGNAFGHLIAAGWNRIHGDFAALFGGGDQNGQGDQDQNQNGDTDNDGDNSGTATSTGTTTSALTISNIVATSTSPHTGTVTWTTNLRASGEVWYSTTSPVDASGTPQATTRPSITNHRIVLRNLTPGTTYYVIVGSKDSNGDTATSTTQVSFTTKSATTTSNNPMITSVTGTTSLVVGTAGTWTVNATDPRGQQLSYAVNWGDGLGRSAFASTSTFTHTYNATGTYTVAFTVRDTGGRTATATSSVTVIPTPVTVTVPVISGVAVSGIGSTTATVGWATNQTATSKVYYSTSTPVIGGAGTLSLGLGTATSTTHSVSLAGLTASTTYRIAVESSDSAGTATSSETSFMTL